MLQEQENPYNADATVGLFLPYFIPLRLLLLTEKVNFTCSVFKNYHCTCKADNNLINLSVKCASENGGGEQSLVLTDC